MSVKRRAFQLSLAILLLAPAASWAEIIQVSLDTAPLIGNGAGPFSLDFQFTDGSGTGDGNNTVVLSNFQFGGGSAVPFGTGLFDNAYTVNASGNLNTSVTMTDTTFFSEFTQQFTPGSTLSFQISLTTNVDAGPTPDQFSFGILDNQGNDIPMLNSPTGSFIVIAINSSSPTVQTFANDPASLDDGVGIGTVGPADALPTPEPVSLALFAVGAVGAGAWRWKRNRMRRRRKLGNRRVAT